MGRGAPQGRFNAGQKVHIYLGAVLLHAGRAGGTRADRARGRREVREFLRLAPRSPDAAAARQLLREG